MPASVSRIFFQKYPGSFGNRAIIDIPTARTDVALTSATLVVLSFSWSLAEEPQSGEVTSGELAFNNACRTCHSVKEGDNRLGPNLYKVFGRKAGSLPNYNYSIAMRSADFVWDKTRRSDCFLGLAYHWPSAGK